MLPLAPIIARILASRIGGAAMGMAARGGAADLVAPPVQSFAKLAATGKNFGDLLSQKVTPAQVQQNAQQDPNQPTPGQAAGGLMGRIGRGALSAATGPAGVATAFAGIIVAGKKLADVMTESQRQFAKFNGQIAFAYARLNRGDLLRSRASAQFTSGSTDVLVSSVNQMRNELRPLKDLGTDALNIIGAGFAKLVTGIAFAVKIMIPIEQAVTWIKNHWPGWNNAPQFGPWQQNINDLAKRSRDRRAANRGFKRP